MPAVDVWESFFDPGRILDAMDCGSIRGDAVEFGSGYGTFTVPLASRLSGTVYALDIDPVMTEATTARALETKGQNVVVQRRDFVIDGSGRPDGSVVLVLLFNILHIEDPVSLLRESRRILRDGGVVGVIHWRSDIETPRGPPLEIRPRPEQCRSWAEQAGLQFKGERNLPDSPWHWGLILER